MIWEPHNCLLTQAQLHFTSALGETIFLKFSGKWFLNNENLEGGKRKLYEARQIIEDVHNASHFSPEIVPAEFPVFFFLGEEKNNKKRAVCVLR